MLEESIQELTASINELIARFDNNLKYVPENAPAKKTRAKSAPVETTTEETAPTETQTTAVATENKAAAAAAPKEPDLLDDLFADEPPVTEEDVRKAIAQLIELNAGDRIEAKNILGTFGVSNIPSIPVEKMADVKKAFDKAIAAKKKG